MSSIHLEILGESQREIFQKLKAFTRFGYLAGGTALALQINHRKSFDFDIFVEKPVSNALRLCIADVFGKQTFSVHSEDQLSFSPAEGCEITFLWYYWKPIVPLVSTDSLSLASIEDIAADKAHTLGRRALWRDYVDLCVLMKEHGMSIPSIIDVAQKKFQGEFVGMQFLEQLSYFDDVTIAPIEYIQKSYTSQEIQSYLINQVDRYAKTITPKAS